MSTALAVALLAAPAIAAEMPMVFLGMGYMPGSEKNGTGPATAALNTNAWFDAGGVGIDTAYMYDDQTGIATALTGKARSDFYLLTKVPGTNGYDKTAQYVREDLQQLGLDYLDMVLVHWCGGSTHIGGCSASTIQDTWKALEDMYNNGTVKGIGISNFCDNDIDSLMAKATVKPMLHQIERHPGYNQSSMLAKCKQEGIPVQGYCPLGDPDRCGAGKSLLKSPAVAQIASAHSITPAQVLLRWQTQQGISVTPRVENVNVDHMKQNLAMGAAGAPTLTDSEMDELNTVAHSTKCWPVGVCGA